MTSLSLTRRSNQVGIALTILIGAGMGLLKVFHVDDVIYILFVSSTNFALGRWYEKCQLHEDGRLSPPQ